MATTITVIGVDKAIKMMNRYDKRVAKVIDLEARKTVLNIVADAVRVAPVDTNFLRSNITVQVRPGSYDAVTKADYSIFVDPKQPFFTLQGLRKLAKFIPKVRSIIRGL